MFRMEIRVGLKFWGFVVRVVKEEVVLDIFSSNTNIELQARNKRKNRENRENRNKEYSKIPTLTQNEPGLNLYSIGKKYYNRENLKQTIYVAKPNTKEYFLHLSINRKYNKLHYLTPTDK